MPTILTAEQLKERYGEQALSQFGGQAQPQQQQQRPGFFSRVGSDLTGRGQDIKSASEQAVEGEIGIGRQVLRTGGAVAGGVFDIFEEGIKSLLGQKGTEAVKTGLGKAVSKAEIPALTENKAFQNAAVGLDDWAKAHPEALKDLENIIDIAAIAPVGKVAQTGVKLAGRGLRTAERVGKAGLETVGKGAALTGAAIEKTGKKVIQTLFTPDEAMAKRIIDFQSKSTMLKRLGWEAANNAKELAKAPKTLVDAIIKYNLSGVARGNIGARAKRVSTRLFENQVKPALSGIKEKASKAAIFDAIKKDIMKVQDISQRKSLLNAFDALADDYKHVSGWTYKTLDNIKSSMAKRLPAKVWKGQDIAGDMNNLRLLFSAHARQTVRKKLPKEILDIYDDYGSLKIIADRGAKALTKGFDSGILGITSEAIRVMATPVATIGGRGIFEGGKAIKRAGQFLQRSKGAVTPKPGGKLPKSGVADIAIAKQGLDDVDIETEDKGIKEERDFENLRELTPEEASTDKEKARRILEVLSPSLTTTGGATIGAKVGAGVTGAALGLIAGIAGVGILEIRSRKKEIDAIAEQVNVNVEEAARQAQILLQELRKRKKVTGKSLIERRK